MSNATSVALSSFNHHNDAPRNFLEDNMELIENKKLIHNANGVTIIIPRPEDMTVDRFLTLAARLEKIVEQLGGNLHVRSE